MIENIHLNKYLNYFLYKILTINIKTNYIFNVSKNWSAFTITSNFRGRLNNFIT